MPELFRVLLNYPVMHQKVKLCLRKVERASRLSRNFSNCPMTTRRECQAKSSDLHQAQRPEFCPPSSALLYRTKDKRFSLRKEVIQPQVLLQLPCYDFPPITSHTLDGCLLAVSEPASSATCFRDVTGGVYKARERIHRGVLIRDY